jgi:hypothetical protein
MTMAITYKLISVTDSITNFGMNITGKLEVSNDDGLLGKNGTCTGHGTMEYDRLNGFPLKEDLSYIMAMDITKNNISVKVQISSYSTHDYKISRL